MLQCAGTLSSLHFISTFYFTVSYFMFLLTLSSTLLQSQRTVFQQPLQNKRAYTSNTICISRRLAETFQQRKLKKKAHQSHPPPKKKLIFSYNQNIAKFVHFNFFIHTGNKHFYIKIDHVIVVLTGRCTTDHFKAIFKVHNLRPFPVHRLLNNAFGAANCVLLAEPTSKLHKSV